MLLLQCTRALLRRLGVSKPPSPEGFGDAWLGPWYAGLIPFDGADLLLFVHEPTLYAVPIGLAEDAVLSDLGPSFRWFLAWSLRRDGIGAKMIQQMLVEYEQITLTTTSSRSTLGSMNDLAGIMLARIDGDLDSLGLVDWPALQRRLNRIPQRKLGGQYAVDVLRQSLREDSGQVPRIASQ